MEKQARIYLPGFYDDEIIELLKDIESVREIRDGFALPGLEGEFNLEKVWHVEFENADIPPKFYPGKSGKKLPTRNIDEIVQYSIYPIRGSNITTTQYSQSEISEDDLTVFKEAPYFVHIYNGQHPFGNENVLSRADGTVVLADMKNLNGLTKLLEKLAPYGSIVTKETQIFSNY